ncbi:MAG TPA: D-aminoacylase [Galbitalea sp.]|jgi:N-acyl-D-amino-acid deacylase
MSPDTLFRRATVVDGTGSARYVADVVVAGGVIRSIGAGLVAGSESRVVDAVGLALSPGFLDMHAHSDLAVISDRQHLAKISQGVTTEVVGQDGLGYVPADAGALARVRRQIAGWNGNPADLALDWGSVARYLDAVDGAATNVAVLVPQGNLRLMVVGDANRAATTAELDAMCAILDGALAEGAVGMSSGLNYVPGMFATTDELIALCRIVAARGGFWAPHTRSYGLGALESYAEMIEIARTSGCALHLTHATMNFAPNRGRAAELLAMIDDALEAGTDVTLDSYPYLAGATTLAALLPSWALSGGLDATLARLDDPGSRERIRVAVDETGSDGCNGLTVEWATIEIAGIANPELAPLAGRRISEIAEQRGVAPADAFFDILRLDALATSIQQHVGDEGNLRLIMQHSTHMAGSDGILVGEKPHPRGWGTFPRYLGHYSRDLALMTLEECVNHLTGRPAARLGLRARGLVREGYAADLVLFDLETIEDAATYETPRAVARGIRAVLVNGEFAIDDGVRTTVTAGRALRSTTAQPAQ